MGFLRVSLLASVTALFISPGLCATTWCPSKESDKGRVLVTYPSDGNQGILSQMISFTAAYGSECAPPTGLGEGEDDVPPIQGPPSIGTYAPGSEVLVQGPWYDIPGTTNEQTRRSERYRRSNSGGCTWATCVNGDWDRLEMHVERRTRPGGLGGGDDTSDK